MVGELSRPAKFANREALENDFVFGKMPSANLGRPNAYSVLSCCLNLECIGNLLPVENVVFL
jgi:hypothetical protein